MIYSPQNVSLHSKMAKPKTNKNEESRKRIVNQLFSLISPTHDCFIGSQRLFFCLFVCSVLGYRLRRCIKRSQSRERNEKHPRRSAEWNEISFFLVVFWTRGINSNKLFNFFVLELFSSRFAKCKLLRFLPLLDSLDNSISVN
jgi:hypothetical protein